MPVSIHYLPIETSGTVPKCKLYLFGEEGHIPVDEFLRELGKSRHEDFNRLGALFRKMVEVGKITNTEHFKDVEGHKPLFEFKGRGVRVYCFREGERWILVEGDDDKKSDSSKNRNKKCIARAERRCEQYLREKSAGRLEVRE